MTFATERETRIASAWDAWHMMGQFWKAQVDFKFMCNVFNATYQGALLSGLGAFLGQNGSLTQNKLSPLKACQNKLARRLLAMTTRKLGRRAKKNDKFRPKYFIENLESFPLRWRTDFDVPAGTKE